MENVNHFIKTPLQYSKPLSDCISHKVYLKLENVQTCNSFKIRGISGLCQKRAEEGCKGFVTFSGGNAGIALAYTAAMMEMPAVIFVPSFVSERILQKLRYLGAQVIVAGTGREAYEQALKYIEDDPKMAFVHPYNDEELWKCYSKIVTEVKEQLRGVKPSCLVLSVGGGGLLMGILTGLEATGWNDIPIVAMETIGAHSFNKSIKAGKIIENHMTSIAKTLGAPSIAPKLLEILPKFNVISEILPDLEAVRACFKFADHHAFLVEPSCGVSLATVYNNMLPAILDKAGVHLNMETGPVVIVVCGGSDSSIEILRDYARVVGLEEN